MSSSMTLLHPSLSFADTHHPRAHEKGLVIGTYALRHASRLRLVSNLPLPSQTNLPAKPSYHNHRLSTSHTRHDVYCGSYIQNARGRHSAKILCRLTAWTASVWTIKTHAPNTAEHASRWLDICNTLKVLEISRSASRTCLHARDSCAIQNATKMTGAAFTQSVA